MKTKATAEEIEEAIAEVEKLCWRPNDRDRRKSSQHYTHSIVLRSSAIRAISLGLREFVGMQRYELRQYDKRRTKRMEWCNVSTRNQRKPK